MIKPLKERLFDSLVSDPELAEGEFTSDQSAKASAAADGEQNSLSVVGRKGVGEEYTS